jgi:hypothetical protein
MQMGHQPDSVHAVEMSRPAPPWLEQPPMPLHITEAMAGHANHGVHGENSAAPERLDRKYQKQGPRRRRGAVQCRQQKQRSAEGDMGNVMTDAGRRLPGTVGAAAEQGAQAPAKVLLAQDWGSGARQVPGGALHEQRHGAAWLLAEAAISTGAQPSVLGLMDDASWVSYEGVPPASCL